MIRLVMLIAVTAGCASCGVDRAAGGCDQGARPADAGGNDTALEGGLDADVQAADHPEDLSSDTLDEALPEPECGVGQQRCGAAGYCIGRGCFEGCGDACEEGSSCQRDGADTSCASAQSCESRGSGMFTGTGCEQSWECGDVTYLVSCKGAEVGAFYSGEVQCTCTENGDVFETFVWQGYPCNGAIPGGHDAEFYNVLCGWALP